MNDARLTATEKVADLDAVDEGERFLRAEDYPILAAIWDNEYDAVYDMLESASEDAAEVIAEKAG